MNETEKDRILRMVSEGILRPNEASQLLAALSEETPAPAAKPTEKEEKTATATPPKPQTIEVQMQRADGSYYTVQLPPNLVPMFLKMAGVMIKESARTAAQETWDGLKAMAKNKTKEVKTTVKDRVSGGGGKKKTETAAPVAAKSNQSEARRSIIQMVQNGRISATDAARLIEQLDALQAHQQTTAPAPSK